MTVGITLSQSFNFCLIDCNRIWVVSKEFIMNSIIIVEGINYTFFFQKMTFVWIFTIYTIICTMSKFEVGMIMMGWWKWKPTVELPLYESYALYITNYTFYNQSNTLQYYVWRALISNYNNLNNIMFILLQYSKQ